jgi:hypothetical protein
VTNATFEEVNKAITKLVTQAQPIATPADFEYVDDLSDSVEDALVKVKVSAGWLGGGVDADLQHQSSHHKSAYVVRFTQAFYSLVWSYPGTIFKPGTTAAALKAATTELAPSYPPVYVKSIVYGRGLVITVSSDQSKDDLKTAIKASLDLGLAGGSGSLDQHSATVLQQSDVHVYALGGGANNAIQLLSGNIVAKLHDYLSKGSEWSPTNPGVPLSFRADYVDASAAQVSFATQYHGDVERNDLAFTSPLLVTFEQTNDDKDPNIKAFLQISRNGNEIIGSWEGGKHENWEDPGARQFSVPITTPSSAPYTERDCTTTRFAFGEREDSSGWHFRLKVEGLLTDGTRVLIHYGPFDSAHPNGYIIGAGRPSGPPTLSGIEASCSF